VSIVFAIYDVEVGGTALWSNSRTVTVNQGVFSVELGDTVPFTLGLFDTPLWIGLTLATDTDPNAVAAILAADGAGSTLDSDKVDGLEASEIIDAAQDEVRTPISSLPVTINQPGSYYLTGNFNGSSGGIDITYNDVTLDLMGFTIDGGGAVSDYGINITVSNVTIQNGTVRGFGLAGNYQDSTAASYARLMDVQVLGNGTLGSGSGIYLASINNHLERCTAGDNGGYGIYAGNSSKLDNNIYSNNTSCTTGQGGLHVSMDSRVTGNSQDRNISGNIYVAGDDNTIKDNHLTNSTNGIFFNADGNYYRQNVGSGKVTTFNLNGTRQTDGGGNISF
jgi:hypothetical protein